MTDLTVAIVSDLHATEAPSRSSLIYARHNHLLRNEDPLIDLMQRVREYGTRADLLLVPGDITDRADSIGLEYGWVQLHQLATALGATILSIPGNHDLVTHDAVVDPRVGLKSLIPSFPSGEKLHDRDFWKQGWAIVEKPGYRVLLLDSTYTFPPYPTTGRTDPDTWSAYELALNRGGFDESQHAGIEDYLRTAEHKLNLAMVHHHPIEHQLRSAFQDSYGPMQRGGELVELLTSYPKAGRWLLIHGHKHIPQLVNSVFTSSNGPVVLCAASLGAPIWSPLSTVTRNQFHVVRVSDSRTSSIGPLIGEILSMMWCLGEGWIEPPPKGAGLPLRTGFGSMIDHRVIANRCAEYFRSTAQPYCTIGEIAAAVPELSYMTPRDFSFLEDELDEINLIFSRDRHQEVQQLSRRA